MFCLTYEFRLKPTQQQEIFEDWLETTRCVYNYALAERKDWYHSRSCQVDACSLKAEYIIPAEASRPVGHTVKMLSEGKAVALPMMKESPH